jgi:ribulose-phosphate 3-epimerase
VTNLAGGIATPELSVGIVSADLLHLGDELERLRAAGVSLLHVDVMDGVFCPQMTVGSPLVAVLPDPFVVDVHLMIVDPLEKVDAYVTAGADIITFHIESAPDPRAVLARLAGRGVTRGVAVNPGTSAAAIEPLLDDLELVLLLAVSPGVSGQSFSPATFDRLAEVRQLIGGRGVLVGVDGGVTLDNVATIGEHAPDLLVAGSAVFKADDLSAAVKALRGALATG